MYPGDEKEQQPANRNLMGEAPEPFRYDGPAQTSSQLGQPPQMGQMPEPSQPQPQAMSPMPGMQPRPGMDDDESPIKKFIPLIVGAAIVLLIIIIAIVALALSNSGNKDNNTNGTNTPSGEQTNNPVGDSASECSTKLRRYQNEDLDIRFCYPAAWGDVKVADGKQDPSDNGTRIRLTFANKPQVHLGLVSDDWSTQVGKGSTCTDPAAQAFPDTSTFSAKWVTTGSPATSAIRGLEVVPDQYLLQERVDNVNVNGACLEGYQAFGGDVYRNAEITYYAQFNSKVATPAAHINNPTALVPVADRNDLTNVTKSIEKF